jgi:uncharacterized membrane protein YkoI
MNTAKLRAKRVVLPTIAAVVVLGIGGAWATVANADVGGSERDRAGDAATRAVPGTVLDVETGDGNGEAYEVEVRKEDGTEVDVVLDKDLKVLSQDTDTPDGAPDADDRALSATERTSAEQAALTAVSGGTVTDVEASDDGTAAYEVDVRAADNTEWDVELDAGFKVLSKTADD